MTFEDLSLNKSLQRALIDQGYTTPTPIQEQAIPIILKGEDLVGCAQTGTGKTAAFAIPILNHLHHMVGSTKKAKKIRALIVTPTRELAIQIGENFDAYGKYTNLIQLTIFGGVSQLNQVDQLKKGVDILIATPGRLLDLNKQGFIDLDNLHFLVLDEADQMLDMGFINDVKKIVKLTPDNRQTLLFSATMPMAIRELADTLLKKPKYVTVSPVSSTAETVKQKIYFVGKANKRKLLYHLITEENLSGVLVFSRTKHGADNVVKALKKNGVKAEAIHGDKSQSARQRVLESFKNKETTVLVATDIAARGIDIDQLPYVINFDLPNVPETYVHRIGRTGRAGNEGIALSFCSVDEKPYWKDILKLTQIQVKTVDHPFPYDAEDLKEETPAEKKKSAHRSAKVASSHSTEKKEPKTESKTGAKSSPKSRKSASSKENKKRWY